MGCFDSVMVPCPNCGKREEFQSKSGPCLLGTYRMEVAPQDVLWNVNRHSPATCEKCGTKFHVELTLVPKSVIYVEPSEVDLEDEIY